MNLESELGVPDIALELELGDRRECGVERGPVPEPEQLPGPGWPRPG